MILKQYQIYALYRHGMDLLLLMLTVRQQILSLGIGVGQTDIRNCPDLPKTERPFYSLCYRDNRYMKCTGSDRYFTLWSTGVFLV